MTSAACSASPCAGDAAAYAYDGFGNRWTETGTLPGSPPPALSFTGDNNRVDGWSYDANGNLLGYNGHTYQYDAENRLISVDGGPTASYVYDAEGRRVHESVGGVVKEFIYGEGGQQLTVVGSSGNLEQAETYIGGRYLGTGEPSAFVWALSDELGTVRVRTNSSGAAVETDTSWPFGAYLNQVGTNSNLHFTGKYRDGETGFDYFGARYYASTLGRFLAPDWSATPEATPYADLSNPQSLNLYGYVLNNPATAADPDGHCWFGFISIGASCGKTKSAPVLEGGTAATGEATLDGSFDVSGILDSLKAGADAVTELGASALTSATVFFALTEDAGNPMEAQILRRGREQAASASARPAPKQTAQDMAAQIQRDLGRKARREFHDAKDTAGRDRTLGELNEDAERIYKGHGKQPPAWMRPGGGR